MFLLSALFIVPTGFFLIVIFASQPSEKDLHNPDFWLMIAFLVVISISLPYSVYATRKNREATINEGREPRYYRDRR